VKKFAFWFILILLPYLFLEGTAFITLIFMSEIQGSVRSPLLNDSVSDKHQKMLKRFIKENSKEGINYITFSKTLGWTIRPNGTMLPLFQANSQGIRANREYALIPPDNVTRIATFGDSFTHCEDVANSETWQEYMNGMNAAVETINFGVGAFGLDQAFLRYQHDGQQFNPHIVLIGFMSENIFRNVNTFRLFYLPNDSLPLAKPRFSVENDTLVLRENSIQAIENYNKLLNNPQTVLPELGKYDYYFQKHAQNTFLSALKAYDFLPSIRLIRTISYNYMNDNEIIIDGRYNEDSEAFAVTTKIFDEFIKLVLKNQAVPIIVLLPPKEDVIEYRTHKTKRYAPLLADFNKKGYQYIDIIDAFETLGQDIKTEDLYVGHISPLGNNLIAKYILQYLSNKNMINSP